MIFVTVGTQGGFDRLICAIDHWAAAQGHRNVFAQVGLGSFEPRYIQWVRFMKPMEFRDRIARASVVVAHAGMGSIITALELGKPILVMPRRGDLREHRNDHQVDTARRFLAQGRISVAFDDRELATKLDELDCLTATGPVTSQASPQLLQTVRRFVDRGIVSCGETGSDGMVFLGPTRQSGAADLIAGHAPALCVQIEDRAQLGRLDWFLPCHARLVAPMGGPAMLGPVQISGAPWRSKGAAQQIRRAIRQLGIRLPQLWTTVPATARLVPQIPHASLIYHRSRLVVRESEIKEDLWLKAHADVTLFSSFAAFERESGGCRRPQMLADFAKQKLGRDVAPDLAGVLSGVQDDRRPVGEVSMLAATSECAAY